MNQYLLYKLPINDIQDILNPCFTKNINDINVVINQSLKYYLNIIKNDIEKYNTKWDKIKRYTYIYEYINSTNKTYNINHPICKINPISRAFFKMIEICNTFNILDELPINYLKSYHLAEAPGGFVEALSYLRNNINDLYYGMTLLDNNESSIPKWKKSKYLSNNFVIENGFTGDGNLMSSDNLLYIYNLHRNSCHIVTGDGGFDFTSNFSNQEKSISKLILCQIAFAISCQAFGGCFILKIFDIFTEITLDLIYLLCNVYEEVYIYKPHTSRTANSEKYIVCKKFRLNDSSCLHLFFYNILINLDNNYIKRLFNFNLPLHFLNKIENINSIIGKKQIENINYTINLIKNNRKNIDLKKNISKCMNWCKINNLPYNIL
jgi:23S rRNA U2552 (ribose-2'-O)-methylase RlmE/FtsJ